MIDEIIFNIDPEFDDLRLGIDNLKKIYKQYDSGTIRDKYDKRIKKHFEKEKNADITDYACYAFNIASELLLFYKDVVLDNFYQMMEKKVNPEYEEPKEYEKIREHGYMVNDGFFGSVFIFPNDDILDKKVTFTVKELKNFIDKVFNIH